MFWTSAIVHVKQIVNIYIFVCTCTSLLSGIDNNEDKVVLKSVIYQNAGGLLHLKVCRGTGMEAYLTFRPQGLNIKLKFSIWGQ
jgi:hypothetical protein